MKKKYLKIYIIGCCIQYSMLVSKITTPRLKGWLELYEIRNNMNLAIEENNNVQRRIQQKTSETLQDSIHTAEQLAQDDPQAALYLYYDMKKLQQKTDQTLDKAQAANEKYQGIIHYIDQQIKALEQIKRKHIQFPY